MLPTTGGIFSVALSLTIMVGGCYPSSCPREPGLSSPLEGAATARPTADIVTDKKDELQACCYCLVFDGAVLAEAVAEAVDV